MAIGRVFPNEIDRVLNYPGGVVGREARALALQIARNASSMASMKLGKHPMDRKRTKQYQNAFRVKVLGQSTNFEVSNNKKYAAALEEGARPHQIKARRVKYLQFRDRQGRWRKVKMVRHPGNPAFQILTNAALVTVRQRYGNIRIS
jgi:hypothetical protein